MSITLSEKDNGYIEGFAGFKKNAPGSDLDWLQSIRACRGHWVVPERCGVAGHP